MVFRLRFTESPPSFALCSGCLPACSRAISKSLGSRSRTTNMVVRRWAGVKDQRKALQWRWINQILSADVLTLTLIWLKLNLSFFICWLDLKNSLIPSPHACSRYRSRYLQQPGVLKAVGVIGFLLRSAESSLHAPEEDTCEAAGCCFW